VAVPRGIRWPRARKLRFADTLRCEHVSLPVNSAGAGDAAAARRALGRGVDHRVVVTNFEAALRGVRAGLAISIVPREVAEAGLARRPASCCCRSRSPGPGGISSSVSATPRRSRRRRRPWWSTWRPLAPTP
jgi:DNA-binding transcriptional LysR family regulator